MIKYATVTSVWDSDNVAITTDCKVNTETKQVFDICSENTEICDYVEILDREYVTIDGEEYPLYQKDEAEDGEYWYE
ncbi:MAG: hypothetical protein IJT36_03305 [Alphaproteobacteria bacterium]|nr:hypothetical protein [Alphaproteobacteria bacterium]